MQLGSETPGAGGSLPDIQANLTLRLKDRRDPVEMGAKWREWALARKHSSKI